MPRDWRDLAAILNPGHGYDAAIGDRHYGATEPLDALPCRCESPGYVRDDLVGEERCWKCGASRPTTTA